MAKTKNLFFTLTVMMVTMLFFGMPELSRAQENPEPTVPPQEIVKSISNSTAADIVNAGSVTDEASFPAAFNTEVLIKNSIALKIEKNNEALVMLNRREDKFINTEKKHKAYCKVFPNKKDALAKSKNILPAYTQYHRKA